MILPYLTPIFSTKSKSPIFSAKSKSPNLTNPNTFLSISLNLQNLTMVAEDEQRSHRTLIFTYGTLKRGFSNHTLIQDMFSTGDATFIGVYKTVDPHPLVCGPFRVPFLLRFPGSGHRVTGELYSVSNRGIARMDELEGTSRGHYERLPIKIAPVDELGGANRGHYERSPIKIARAAELEGTNCGYNERSPIKVARAAELEGTNCGHNDRSTIKVAHVDEVEGTNRGQNERSPIKISRVNGLKTNGCVEEDDEGLTCAQAYYAHDSYAKELWTKCGEKGFGSYSEKEARGYVKRGDRPRDLSFREQINKFVFN